MSRLPSSLIEVLNPIHLESRKGPPPVKGHHFEMRMAGRRMDCLASQRRLHLRALPIIIRLLGTDIHEPDRIAVAPHTVPNLRVELQPGGFR
jgi:hypothetical protein